MVLGTIYPLKVIIIASVGVMLGFGAAFMGFQAEGKRITAHQLVWVDGENRCYMPPNQIVSLSIMAGLLHLLSQVGLTVAGGCPCCDRKIDKFTDPAPLAIKSLISSWISCIVAVTLFFYGAGVTSNYHARAHAKPLPAATSASCGYAINAFVYMVGGVFAFLGTIRGAIYYLAVSRINMNRAEHLKPQAKGIELGLTNTNPATELRTI